MFQGRKWLHKTGEQVVMQVVIRMSHWRQQMVDGAEHLISCHWLAFLSAFSHLQLIQNSAPSTEVGVNVTSECGAFYSAKKCGGGAIAPLPTLHLRPCFYNLLNVLFR